MISDLCRLSRDHAPEAVPKVASDRGGSFLHKVSVARPAGRGTEHPRPERGGVEEEELT